MSPKDPHVKCLLCRPCTRHKPCEFEKGWSKDDWKISASKKDQKRLKRADAASKRKRDGKGSSQELVGLPPSKPGKTGTEKSSGSSVSTVGKAVAKVNDTPKPLPKSVPMTSSRSQLSHVPIEAQVTVNRQGATAPMSHDISPDEVVTQDTSPAVCPNTVPQTPVTSTDPQLSAEEKSTSVATHIAHPNPPPGFTGQPSQGLTPALLLSLSQPGVVAQLQNLLYTLGAGPNLGTGEVPGTGTSNQNEEVEVEEVEEEEEEVEDEEEYGEEEEDGETPPGESSPRYSAGGEVGTGEYTAEGNIRYPGYPGGLDPDLYFVPSARYHDDGTPVIPPATARFQPAFARTSVPAALGAPPPVVSQPGASAQVATGATQPVTVPASSGPGTAIFMASASRAATVPPRAMMPSPVQTRAQPSTAQARGQSPAVQAWANPASVVSAAPASASAHMAPMPRLPARSGGVGSGSLGPGGSGQPMGTTWTQGYHIPRVSSGPAPLYTGPSLPVQVPSLAPSASLSFDQTGWPLEAFSDAQRPGSDAFCGMSVDGVPLFRPPQLLSEVAPPTVEKFPQVLSPVNARLFWEKVLTDAGLPIEYAPSVEQSFSLGVLERSSRQPMASVPFIPIADSIKVSVEDTHKSAKVGRMSWVQRVLPVSEGDSSFFTTPLCPEACFSRMEEDKHSFCVPLRPTPQGVESSGPPRKSMPPFKVGAWNRSRDEDLRKVESLARDGLRVSNAALLALAHLANSIQIPGREISVEERTRTIEVLRDLSHTSIDHYVRIIEQSIVSRRMVAAQAVNLADRAGLLAAPLGPDLFGGQWSAAAEAETAFRKRKADQAALKAKGSSKRLRGRGTFGRGRGRAPQVHAPMIFAMPQPQQQRQQWGASAQVPAQPLLQPLVQPYGGHQPSGRGRGRRPQRTRPNRRGRGRGARGRGGRGGSYATQPQPQYF